MVLNIEPALFDEERSSYRTEDLVVVTETGYYLLALLLAPNKIAEMGHNIM